MKKKIVFLALFTFFVFFANADVFNTAINNSKFYPGLGFAGAGYLGTTENNSIDSAYNSLWDFWKGPKRPFDGKLSKRQNALLWYGLAQYDYEADEIYHVTFSEYDFVFYELIVQINADGSCTWKGFMSTAD